MAINFFGGHNEIFYILFNLINTDDSKRWVFNSDWIEQMKKVIIDGIEYVPVKKQVIGEWTKGFWRRVGDELELQDEDLIQRFKIPEWKTTTIVDKTPIHGCKCDFCSKVFV